MFNRFFYNFIFALALGTAVGCSSGGGGGEDTDISEIKEIEQTGEFSEDEFFSSDGMEEMQEETLVEDVPGLEDDLNVSEETGEQPLGDDLGDLDVALEGEEDDLFDDAGFGEEITASEESNIGENVEVESEDLDSLLSEDLGDEDFGVDSSDVVASNESTTEEPLELDSEDDLFRDIDEPLAESEENTDDLFSSDDPAVDTTTPGDSMASGGSYSDIAQSDMSEDVVDAGPEDYSYNDDVLSEDQTSSDLLAEDISVDDVDYSSYDETGETTTAQEKNYIPVKKMRTVPYTKNGVLVNAIYFVRQGDSLNSIGQKIYGSGSGVDFTIVNPHLKPGNLKVGQKVYYNSPQRPQDNSRLLTYYQDVQAPAQTYAARQSENIRELSETLLGHPRSWMEVWATNMEIESKWALEAPYQIRYWKGGGFNPAPESQPTMAKNESSFGNQANLGMAPEKDSSFDAQPSTEPEPSPFETDLAMDDSSFDEPDTSANAGTVDNNNSPFGQNAGQAQNDPMNDPVDNELDAFEPDLAAEEPVMDEVAENDPFTADPQDDTSMAATQNPQNPRDVARNESGFQEQQSQGGLMDDPMKLGIIGGALLLLLLVGYMVVKRRKETDDVVEMESFDFGGETMIDEEANKTQIDI